MEKGERAEEKKKGGGGGAERGSLGREREREESRNFEYLH